jgi:hypothetical protein
MEFAVLGDTVNVASRLQEMTRRFNLAIVASDDVIAAAQAEVGGLCIAPFQDLGLHELRGRDGAIRLWGRAADAHSSQRMSNLGKGIDLATWRKGAGLPRPSEPFGGGAVGGTQPNHPSLVHAI